MKNFIENFDKRMDEKFSHPKNVCMTYTEHFKFSLYLSFIFFKGSVQGIIHSFYPDIYKSYAQDTILITQKLLKTNGCVD